jgi:hypothetical protein
MGMLKGMRGWRRLQPFVNDRGFGGNSGDMAGLLR